MNGTGFVPFVPFVPFVLPTATVDYPVAVGAMRRFRFVPFPSLLLPWFPSVARRRRRVRFRTIFKFGSERRVDGRMPIVI